MVNDLKKINYSDLTKYTFEILKDKPNIARIASEYLHPRNTHPQSLRIYRDIFNKNFFLFSFFKHLIKSILLLIVSIIRNERDFFGNELPKKADVIFISHLTNESQLDIEKDPYYGHLIHNLNKEKKHVLLVTLINHTWIKERDISKKNYKIKKNNVILSRTSNVIREIKYIFMLLKEGLHLYKTSSLDKKKKLICQYAFANIISSSSIMAIRTFYQIKEILRLTNPSYLITTFEGHAWERLVFHAVESSYKNIQCYAYQHSVLFPNQNAIFRKIKMYNPHLIFTPGKISYKVFQSKHKDTKNIAILGSPRSTQYPAISRTISTQASILFLPEGIKSETDFLLKSAVSLALKYPQRRIIFRLHPVLNYRKYKTKLLKKINNATNLVLSNKSFEEDISSSNIAVYRGSSTIITAILNGLYPIYLSKNSDFKLIDPLFMVNDINRIALSQDDLSKKVIYYENLNKIQKLKFLKKLQLYCNDYFHPISFKNFLKYFTETHTTPKKSSQNG